MGINTSAFLGVWGFLFFNLHLSILHSFICFLPFFLFFIPWLAKVWYFCNFTFSSMANLKLLAALATGFLSSFVVAAPTATVNSIGKRAEISDVFLPPIISFWVYLVY